ncbi:MAG: peptidase [Gaiellaceae bacterium]|nr:peptidase [Gaiellaceae bacterium]
MRRSLVLAAFLLIATPAPAAAAGDPNVAGLQGALRAQGFYDGPIDGIEGPSTREAVVRAQRRARLVPDGVAGRLTRRALRVRPFAGRTLRPRSAGSDVVALQFALAWRGFPSGELDGRFGPRLERAVLRFQRHVGLRDDGVAGPQTLRALRGPPPRAPALRSWPLTAAVTNGFGPSGDRFHSGVDIPASSGSPVSAAAPGRVAFAARAGGGWGRLVSIAHRGFRTLYAHLSRIDVRVGQRVRVGTPIGRVGASGRASGPHLHFELRVRGAAVDPLPALP